jgi:site-specific DNA-methyltransferase (adenine-specific)
MTPFRNSIIHADCIKALPMLPDKSVDFILTDPPYITNYQARDGRRVPNDDNDKWLKPAFAQMHRVLKADGYCFTFYGWPHADRFMEAFRSAGFRPVGHFSFPKSYTSSVGHVLCQHECAYLLAKGDPGRPSSPLGDVIQWGDNTGNKFHPTEKSISALLPVIETYSSKTGTVLDPFAGSGSSLIAAKMLGRNYIGIEVDAKYHSVAKKRLESHR